MRRVSRTMQKGQLRCDLQGVLEEFCRIKRDYCNSKINLKAKEEIIELQKTNMEAAYKRVDMIAKALENYQRKYQENLLRYQGENYQLSQQIQGLEEKIRILQQSNQDLVVEGNDERVRRMEEQVQVLEARIAVQEELHEEKIAKLRGDYEEQVSEKMRVIEELNAKIKKLNEQTVTQRGFVHPALYEEVNKGKRNPVVNKKTPISSFKWPNLDVQKIIKTPDPTPPPKRKKKKLYNADDTDIVDLL